MDRNSTEAANLTARVMVALRKESVDRNTSRLSINSMIHMVALRKESVDRNLYYGDGLTFADGSLSARRAWIEIASNRRIQRYPLRRSPQGERG